MGTVLLAALLISALGEPARTDDESDPSPRNVPPLLTAPFDLETAKAAQGEWAKHLGKSSPVEKNSIDMELVLIPAGRFRMGSPASEKDRDEDEDQVDVALTRQFYLGKTEVTQAQWRVVMGTAPWRGQKYVNVGGNYPVIDAREGDNYPATFVSWEDARAFCKTLSEKERAVYRLPTEAEWEYACRGGTTTQFSFGDEQNKLGEYAWWGGLSGKGIAKTELYPHEVGRKRANPFGLHDMHGNVWELCEDMYVDKRRGGIDPLVSSGGSHPVDRGGSWGNVATHCRSAVRNRGAPTNRTFSLGFRVARSDAK
jgi:formylglycine-generating enzyme required for sulfatase activity